MQEERKCPECSRPIMGRADKKFCSDLCRNAYNNRSNSDANNLVRNINRVLKKNRRILEKLAPSGKTKVHRSKLEKEAFDFNYHTSIYTTKEHKNYYFCYDYGYLELSDNYFILVKRDL